MRQVFDHLWTITDDYLRTVGSYNLVPWWGNEVSLCGLMTAAAVKAGFVSLGEFSEKKLEDTTPGKGRVDWWVTNKEYEIVAEAKALWLGPGSSLDRVYASLKEAGGQLRAYYPEGSNDTCGNLQIVFARLEYGKHNDPANAWNDWFGDDSEPADPAKVSYMAYYLLKPNDVFGERGFPYGSEGHLYPGLVICCRDS
jgi:hypothetical protein